MSQIIPFPTMNRLKSTESVLQEALEAVLMVKNVLEEFERKHVAPVVDPITNTFNALGTNLDAALSIPEPDKCTVIPFRVKSSSRRRRPAPPSNSNNQPTSSSVSFASFLRVVLVWGLIGAILAIMLFPSLTHVTPPAAETCQLICGEGAGHE